MTRQMVVAFEGLLPLQLDDNKVLGEKLHCLDNLQVLPVKTARLRHFGKGFVKQSSFPFQPTIPILLRLFFSTLYAYFDTMFLLACLSNSI